MHPRVGKFCAFDCEDLSVGRELNGKMFEKCQSQPMPLPLHRLYIDRCITVKPFVATGVKADRLCSVRWKDNHTPHVYYTDRVILAAFRCIEF